MFVSRMQVLLFLTALLSALSGVVAGPTVDESRRTHAQEQLIATVAAVAPARQSIVRPVQAAPSLARMILPGRIAVSPARPAPLSTVKFLE